MSEDDGWITGPALQTIIALRGMQRGNQVWCSACNDVHIIHSWPPGSERPHVSGDDDGICDHGTIDPEDIAAWRAKGTK